MKRVIVYIDGYNLYYGLRSKGWKRFYWLNLQTLAQLMLKPTQTLVFIKYFTSVVTHPPDRGARQAIFLEALRTLNNFKIYFGHFLAEQITCRQCGHTYTTYHEKMTDVNIATELLTDAFQDNFDVALIISADSDLVAPVEAIKCLFPAKRVVIAFPPGRHSHALKQAACAYTYINHAILTKSTFPDDVVKPDGFTLRRPPQWH